MARRQSRDRSLRRPNDRWYNRFANELYVGAMILGLLVVAAGTVALVIQAVFGVSRWVQLGD